MLVEQLTARAVVATAVASAVGRGRKKAILAHQQADEADRNDQLTPMDDMAITFGINTNNQQYNRRGPHFNRLDVDKDKSPSPEADEVLTELGSPEKETRVASRGDQKPNFHQVARSLPSLLKDLESSSSPSRLFAGQEQPQPQLCDPRSGTSLSPFSPTAATAGRTKEVVHCKSKNRTTSSRPGSPPGGKSPERGRNDKEHALRTRARASCTKRGERRRGCDRGNSGKRCSARRTRTRGLKKCHRDIESNCTSSSATYSYGYAAGSSSADSEELQIESDDDEFSSWAKLEARLRRLQASCPSASTSAGGHVHFLDSQSRLFHGSENDVDERAWRNRGSQTDAPRLWGNHAEVNINREAQRGNDHSCGDAAALSNSLLVAAGAGHGANPSPNPDSPALQRSQATNHGSILASASEASACGCPSLHISSTVATAFSFSGYQHRRAEPAPAADGSAAADGGRQRPPQQTGQNQLRRPLPPTMSLQQEDHGQFANYLRRGCGGPPRKRADHSGSASGATGRTVVRNFRTAAHEQEEDPHQASITRNHPSPIGGKTMEHATPPASLAPQLPTGVVVNSGEVGERSELKKFQQESRRQEHQHHHDDLLDDEDMRFIYSSTLQAQKDHNQEDDAEAAGLAMLSSLRSPAMPSPGRTRLDFDFVDDPGVGEELFPAPALQDKDVFYSCSPGRGAAGSRAGGVARQRRAHISGGVRITARVPQELREELQEFRLEDRSAQNNREEIDSYWSFNEQHTQRQKPCATVRGSLTPSRRGDPAAINREDEEEESYRRRAQLLRKSKVNEPEVLTRSPVNVWKPSLENSFVKLQAQLLTNTSNCYSGSATLMVPTFVQPFGVVPASSFGAPNPKLWNNLDVSNHSNSYATNILENSSLRVV